MFRIFGAILRRMKAWSLRLVGIVDEGTEEVLSDPNAMRAEGKEAIQEKVRNLNSAKDALTRALTRQETLADDLNEKAAEVEDLTDEVQSTKFELKEYAKKFKSAEEANRDQTFLDLKDDLQSAKTELAAADARRKQLDEQLDELSEELEGHEFDVKQFQESIKQDEVDIEFAIVDVVTQQEAAKFEDAMGSIDLTTSSARIERIKSRGKNARNRRKLDERVSGKADDRRRRRRREQAKQRRAGAGIDAELFGSAPTEAAATDSVDDELFGKADTAETEAPSQLPE